MKLFRELYHYREMLFSLVRKDLRGRYKGSVLGFLWTFINPLMQLLVYTFVFTVILPAQVEHYSLYLFVALIPWIFFSAAMTGGAGSIVAQKDLVKKIYFPREIIPISYVTSCFVNMLLCFLIIFLVMLVTGATFNLLAFLCLPIIMVVEYLLALGIVMLSAAITVYFRDLEHILGIVSMIFCDILVEKKFSVNSKTKGMENNLLKTGIIVSIGLAIHNFPEGLAIGSGFEASLKLGLSLAIAICLHDIPEGRFQSRQYA